MTRQMEAALGFKEDRENEQRKKEENERNEKKKMRDLVFLKNDFFSQMRSHGRIL